MCKCCNLAPPEATSKDIVEFTNEQLECLEFLIYDRGTMDALDYIQDIRDGNIEEVNEWIETYREWKELYQNEDF